MLGEAGKGGAMQKLGALLDRYPRWLALLAGGVSATGVAPLDLWPLTLLCLALLMHLVAHAATGKGAFMIGWLFGLGHFTIGNNWIATAFTYQSNMPAWLGWLAVPLLAVYLAIYPGLAAFAAWWFGRFPLPLRKQAGDWAASQPQPRPNLSPEGTGLSVPFILAFAGCWIVSEWLRSWVFTGFAWNPLSAISVDTLLPSIWLPIIGTYGLSGLVVWAAGMLALLPAWIRRNHARQHFSKSGSWVAAALLLVFVGPVAVAILFPQILPKAPTAISTSGAQLTIVQPNISQIDKYKPGYDAINFSRLAQNSQPKDGQPRLILWPEAAIPWRLEEGYPFRYYQFQPGESALGARLVLTRLMAPGDVLLTGVDRLEFDKDEQLVGARNSMTAIDSSGRILANYDKAHLVPYGEYLALRWLLEPLGATRLVPGDIDFWPGPGPRTLAIPFDGRKVKVGMQICYEIIFSGQIIDPASRPDFIFNPSNDAWFGGWYSPQMLAQSRLRAIEEGLPVVRATPTGISSVIDAEGRVLHSRPRSMAGRINARLPIAKAPTLFARHGNILPLGFAALMIAFALLPLARTRFSR
jgi:apolipoprotein N-acyltransferase